MGFPVFAPLECKITKKLTPACLVRKFLLLCILMHFSLLFSTLSRYTASNPLEEALVSSFASIYTAYVALPHTILILSNPSMSPVVLVAIAVLLFRLGRATGILRVSFYVDWALSDGPSPNLLLDINGFKFPSVFAHVTHFTSATQLFSLRIVSLISLRVIPLKKIYWTAANVKAPAKSVRLRLPPFPCILSEKLQNYRLLKKLGEGSFGSVYLAETTFSRDISKRSFVAIKVICRSHPDVTLRTIHEEKRLLKMLTDCDSRPGYFPRLIESFCDANNYYFVQEYIPGGTLHDEIEREGGKLSLSRVKFIMAQLLTVVRSLHEMGVLRRDIKPENIMFDGCGNVILTDLGLSTDLTKKSRRDAPGTPISRAPRFRTTQRRCGTPGYMAPEVYFRREYQFSADLYSLGVVFYEMVAGIHPFPYNDSQQVRNSMITFHFPVPLDAFPSVLKDLLSKLLRFIPEERINLDDAMRHPFFSDVEWLVLERRSYILPPKWAPPVIPIDWTQTIDKTTLIDPRETRGRRRHAPVFDRKFTTSRQAPIPERRLPATTAQPENGLKAYMHRLLTAPLSFDCIRRRTVLAGFLIPYPPQGDERVELKVDACVEELSASGEIDMYEVEMIIVEDLEQPGTPIKDDVEHVLEQQHSPDKDAIQRYEDTTRGPHADDNSVLVCPIPAAAATPAISIPRRPQAIRIPESFTPPTECKLGNGMSLFDASIEALDEILLSPPLGLAPGRAFVFTLPSCSSSPSGSTFLAIKDAETNPVVPQEESPPYTPAPTTPTSYGFVVDTINEEHVSATELPSRKSRTGIKHSARFMKPDSDITTMYLQVNRGRKGAGAIEEMDLADWPPVNSVSS